MEGLYNNKDLYYKAIENGIIKADPLKGIIVRKPEGNRLYLFKEEVLRLETKYSGFMTKDLKNVLQYFLFSCYTGLRYSDVKNLRFSNIEYDTDHPCIKFKQKKTSELVIMPLGKKAQKYIPAIGLPNQPVFNVYCNQVTNRLLKDIMTLTGINKNISFHCARHTFAAFALELSRDIATVSNLLGHMKISTTQIYAKVLEVSKRNVIGLMDAI